MLKENIDSLLSFFFPLHFQGTVRIFQPVCQGWYGKDCLPQDLPLYDCHLAAHSFCVLNYVFRHQIGPQRMVLMV